MLGIFMQVMTIILYVVTVIAFKVGDINHNAFYTCTWLFIVATAMLGKGGYDK